MILEYVDVRSARVLDVIEVSESGGVSYDTGAAQPAVDAMVRHTGSVPAAMKELASWSNGYVLTREQESESDQPGLVDAQVAALDAAMEPVTVKVVCWGAVTSDVFPGGNPAEMVHKTYTESGFVSVTTDRSAVEVGEGSWLAAVVVPEGMPAIYVAEDRELVIARGTTFRVVSFNGETNVVKVVALVPEHEGAGRG